MSFPYVIVVIFVVWFTILASYLVARWRQKSKAAYIIPRVFVLCSPRTVQFHYELILRIGLPSSDFNPDKHDIDITVYGQQKNEVVPMTRLNTKTLFEEPLITSLSIIAYRLVEMPQLGSLLLKHSGPYKSFVYCYDFTVIDLSTNREYYYVINQYINSVERFMHLDEPNKDVEVKFPIDDVPLPQWTTEDMYIFFFAVINATMLNTSLMPVNCNYIDDVVSVLLISLGVGCLVFFLDWLLYYNIAWSRDRREYFNQTSLFWFFTNEYFIRVTMVGIAGLFGMVCIYSAISIDDGYSTAVWCLVTTNSCSLVLGIWNVARQVELGESIVGLGLRFQGVETVGVGMRYADLVADLATETGSESDVGSSISSTGKLGAGAPSIGPRSSVKTLGFDLASSNSSVKGGGVRGPAMGAFNRVASQLGSQAAGSHLGSTLSTQSSSGANSKQSHHTGPSSSMGAGGGGGGGGVGSRASSQHGSSERAQHRKSPPHSDRAA